MVISSGLFISLGINQRTPTKVSLRLQALCVQLVEVQRVWKRWSPDGLHCKKTSNRPKGAESKRPKEGIIIDCSFSVALDLL